MGFIDNVRSRFKNNEEDEFEQAFRTGAWPEGVVDFAPLANTGSFLPTSYDVDPLADESLPGNAPDTANAPAQQPVQQAGPAVAAAAQPAAGQVVTESVVRAAATSIYAAPMAQSPFEVIDSSLQPRAVPSAPDATAQAGAQIGAQVGAQDSFMFAALAASELAAGQAPHREPAPYQDFEEPAPYREPVAHRGPAAYGEAASRLQAGASASRPQAAPQPWDRPEPASRSQAGAPAAPAQMPSGYSAGTPRYDIGDGGVQVVARPAGERAPRAAAPYAEQKPFADRLRERVAAANVSGQADETLGRSRAGMQVTPPPVSPQRPARRSENASAAELDAELEERRRTRRSAQSRDMRDPRDARAGERTSREMPPERREAPRTAERDVRPSPSAPAAPIAPKPVPISCTVVRPRSYDDVKDVAQGVLAEHRPVVLVLKGCTNELARRVLDFSFGLCCASGAGMREFGDHVYAVLPRGTALTDEDLVSLRRQGIVRG